jgi:thymidylate synthase
MERAYLDALKEILTTGVDRTGRNGNTRAKFAIQLRHDFKDGFPALTTKKLAFKAVKSELLWFIEGSQDDNRLRELNGTDRTIWTANAEADYWTPKAEFPGDLGRIYGVQWRRWQRSDGSTLDQLARVIDKIKNDPADRRLIVSAWNPGELEQMALPPCHMFFQFFVSNDRLSIHIASYALLLAMVAQVTDKVPHELVLTLNDAHIYHDHFDAVEEQLSREPLPYPTLWLNPDIRDIDRFTMDDIRLEDYRSHEAIKAAMTV